MTQMPAPEMCIILSVISEPMTRLLVTETEYLLAGMPTPFWTTMPCSVQIEPPHQVAPPEASTTLSLICTFVIVSDGEFGSMSMGTLPGGLPSALSGPGWMTLLRRKLTSEQLTHASAWLATHSRTLSAIVTSRAKLPWLLPPPA